MYRRCVPRVYALALRLEGNHAAAEDLTQEVFLKVWRSLSSFREESSLETWIHAIAVRTSVDRFRRGGPQADAQPQRVEAASDACQPWHGADLDLERAIAALPPGMRRYFVLHAIEGYHLREIADMFGVAVGTVQSQVFDARRKLRKALGGPS